MFTGIIQCIGDVVSVDDSHLTVAVADLTARSGDSIAVNGCCLTLTADLVPGGNAHFEMMPHTRQRTALAALAIGDRVNLEPALAAGHPLGGHLVQGHVDGVGTVRHTRIEDNSLVVTIDAPAEITRYCIPRGSITIDGVSLTVIEVDDSSIVVSLIPETRHRTTLGSCSAGTRVNLESDVIARYVERLLTPWLRDVQPS